MASLSRQPALPPGGCPVGWGHGHGLARTATHMPVTSSGGHPAHMMSFSWWEVLVELCKLLSTHLCCEPPQGTFCRDCAYSRTPVSPPSTPYPAQTPALLPFPELFSTTGSSVRSPTASALAVLSSPVLLVSGQLVPACMQVAALAHWARHTSL